MTDVTIEVFNRLGRPVDLVLEPWGEVYPLARDERRTVIYSGDRHPRMSLEITANEIKIWAEGQGILNLAEPEADGAND